LSKELENKGIERIVITGCPGTGKTTLAEELGKELGLKVIHVDRDFIKENDLGLGFDKDRDSVEVDLEKLEDFLKGEKAIIESHLLCEIELKDALVIVLRCDPSELRNRLEKRGYSEGKIRENVEAEIVDYCVEKARENYSEVHEVETTDRDVEETKQKCLEIISEV